MKNTLLLIVYKSLYLYDVRVNNVHDILTYELDSIIYFILYIHCSWNISMRMGTFVVVIVW